MKFESVLTIFFLCFSIGPIEAQFDGQASCALSKPGREKRSSSGTSWLGSSSFSKKKVKFFVYNKKRNDEKFDPIEISPDNKFSLHIANFDVKKSTIIIIHGYKGSKNSSVNRLLREGFFKNGDFNLIIVDWCKAQHKWSFLWPYDVVVKKLEAVSGHVSDMLRFLEHNGLNFNTTTIVGHSLGAHVAGMASYKAGSRISRLVGLDPAGPLMSNRSPARRLSQEDALQIEIIHTEMDECGLKNQMGHYDFYVNGGRVQPGCATYRCSHARSYEYFAESLNPNTKGFYARRCDDWSAMQKGNCNGEWILMGGLDPTSAEYGIYYVKTNNRSPFARGPQ